VNQDGLVSDVDFRVRLNHTFDRDVELYLIHPDGSMFELSADNGGGGDNYGAGAQNCSGTFSELDDSATQFISPDGVAPFVGTFRPELALARFQGKAAGGTWSLRIIDDEPPDSGTLFCWQLEVTSAVR
jgi:subtilisin-like proprotein convertase family protein